MPKVVKQTARPKRKRRVKKVVDRIQPIADWEGGGIKINVYGRNGTGKTTLACTFLKKLLLIGFEDGTKSVRKVKGVDFVLVQHTDELQDLADYARDNYKTAVMDTVTSLQDLVLKELLDLKKVPVQSSWGAVSRDQYRKRSERTREFMRLFLDLPIHVVALAQEKDHTNKEEATTDGEVLDPFIASNLGATTCGWLHDACDYICQTFIREGFTTKVVRINKKRTKIKSPTGETEYCLRTAVHPMYASKMRVDRATKIPDAIVDPSFAKLSKLF